MADSLLIQGKEAAWLVNEETGAALVTVVGSNTSEKATRLDVVSSTVTYVGKAAIASATSSAVWQVQRLTSGTDGDLTIEWADGNADFDNVWDNRASLSYS